MFTITPIGIEAVIKSLKSLKQKASDLTPVMEQIGNFIKNRTELSFEEQKSPFGEKWIPSKRAEKNNDLTLIDTGSLSTSITYSANKDSVQVGTNLIYAPIHQFGGKAGRGKTAVIPSRPFLPITQEGEMPEEVIKSIVNIISKQFTSPSS